MCRIIRPHQPHLSALLQFRVHSSEVGLRLRTGASPVLRLRPPQAGKQAAKRTAPPSTLHFRISPAYRNIYPYHKTPWGIHRNKPARGRFFPSRLSYFGGNVAAAYIVPPPRRRASPSQKTNRRSLLSPVATLLPVTIPSFNGSKGEGQPPSRGRGPEGRKKRKRPCLRFFPGRSASYLPRQNSTTAGRTLPARIFVFPSHYA
jgi:hypothetical protein